MPSLRSPASSRWLAGLVLLATLLAACDRGGEPPPETQPTAPPGDAADGVAPAEGGTVVWGFAHEPRTLNPTIEDGSVLATAQVALATVLPLWVVTPEWEYQPTALLERAEVDHDAERFAVTYHLAEDAAWSDGTPITAADVWFTLQTCRDARWEITDRTACERVDMTATEAALDPAAKEVEVVFVEPYGSWQTLFSTADGVILPSHLLRGEDWSTAWDDEIPIASGPFRFESWDRGDSLVLVRNEAYAGEPAALDRIVVSFPGSEDALLRALRNRDVHLVEPEPRLEAVQQLEAMDEVEVQTADGPIWEQVSFQQDRPPLDDEVVRTALSQGIDREAIVEEVVAPIRPEAEPLGSLVRVRGQPGYVDHVGDLHDPEAAIAALEEIGCERGDDGVFVCRGERLSLEYTTTEGDERRAITAELVREQLAAIGVEVTPRFEDPVTLFSDEILRAGAWELLGFAWVAGADPATDVQLWSCEGLRNHTGHCDTRVTDLLTGLREETDEEARLRALDRAGRRLADALPVLPLYQVPSVAAVASDAVTGPRVNPTGWGLVWNVGEWQAAAADAG